MHELRWVYRHGRPEQGWLRVGSGTQAMWQVLQYRTIENPLEEGLQEPIYSEWEDVPFGSEGQ